MAEEYTGDPLKATTPREVIQGLMAQFSQLLGSPEQCAAVLKSHAPDWDGKIETLADVKRLSDLLEKKFGVGEKMKLPEEVFKALTGLIAGRWGATAASEVTDRFGQLNVAESVFKLWQVFSTSVDAKRKGGRATTKWTPEIERIARPIFDELKRAGLSDHASYTRTIAKLKSEHGISIGLTTIKRHLLMFA